MLIKTCKTSTVKASKHCLFDGNYGGYKVKFMYL